MKATLRLNPIGNTSFDNWPARLVFDVLISTVVVLLTFSTLLSSVSVEQDNDALRCANMQQQIVISVDHQSECVLSIINLLQKSSSPLVSYDRPIAVLSLSGTLGDNGWYTSNVEASLSLTGDDSSSLTIEYTFYNQEWITYSEPFTIFEEGQTAIYYHVRNSTGFIWETTVATVDIDKTPPYGSVLIEEGANEAFSTLVNLTFSVTDEPSGPTTPPPPGYIWGVPSGPSVIRFSNDGRLWSNWEAVANRKSWTLGTGAGNKTVYVQARDNAGLVSEPFSDTINLVTSGDTVAPVTKVIVNGKQDSSGVYTSAVAVTLSAVDDLSGVSRIEYSFDSQSWITYTAPLPIYTQGETTIYYRSIDAEGNVEATNSHTINIDKVKEADAVMSPLVIAVAAVAIGGLVLGVVGRKRRNSRISQEKKNSRSNIRVSDQKESLTFVPTRAHTREEEDISSILKA